MNKEDKPNFYSYFVWILAILFFFYEFFLRVLPATLSNNIIQSLNITIEQYSMIGSAYYLTYAFMQIPVGLLLDRFSPKKLITFAVGLCAFGAFWFTYAQGFTVAFFSRSLIGLGSSFGFISLMIVTLNWFPKRYFAYMLGWGQFLGAIGPLVAGAPIAYILSLLEGNWRAIFLGVALFGILLTFMIGFFLKGKKIDPDAILFIDRKQSLKTQIIQILSNPQIWWVMAFAATVYVSLPLMGAFWGTAYLEVKGFAKTDAAFIVSMIWIGLAIGCPLIGKLSDKWKKRVPFLVICSLVGLVSSLSILFGHSTNKIYLSFLFFLVGFGGSGQSLSFAIMAENAPKKLKATALGLNNTAIMALASILPNLVASIIQHYKVDNQLSILAFEKGLIVLPLVFFIALIISLVGIKETFCRQQQEIQFINKPFPKK